MVVLGLSLSTRESWSSRALKGIKLFSQVVNAFLEGHEWVRSCVDLLVPFWPAWHTCAHGNTPRVQRRAGGARPRQESGGANRPRGATRTGIPEPSALLTSLLRGVASWVAFRTARKWVAGNFPPPRCACPRDPFCKKQVCTQPVGEVSNPTAVTLRERKNR